MAMKSNEIDTAQDSNICHHEEAGDTLRHRLAIGVGMNMRPYAIIEALGTA